jgi:hypothetical protein
MTEERREEFDEMVEHEREFDGEEILASGVPDLAPDPEPGGPP